MTDKLDSNWWLFACKSILIYRQPVRLGLPARHRASATTGLTLKLSVKYTPWSSPSKYSSNFRRWSPCLRVCHLICDFTARRFALFAVADQRLTEQRRNSEVGE